MSEQDAANAKRWERLMKYIRQPKFDQSRDVTISLTDRSGARHSLCALVEQFEQVMDGEHLFFPEKEGG